jgi:hypothetical protein
MMELPQLSDEWEGLSPEQVIIYRSRFNAYVNTLTHPQRQGSRRQLKAIKKPMESVQDVILTLNKLMLK